MLVERLGACRDSGERLAAVRPPGGDKPASDAERETPFRLAPSEQTVLKLLQKDSKGLDVPATSLLSGSQGKWGPLFH